MLDSRGLVPAFGSYNERAAILHDLAEVELGLSDLRSALLRRLAARLERPTSAPLKAISAGLKRFFAKRRAVE